MTDLNKGAKAQNPIERTLKMGPRPTHIFSLSLLLSFHPKNQDWGERLASVEFTIPQAHYSNSSHYPYNIEMIVPILQIKILRLRESKLIAHKPDHNKISK